MTMHLFSALIISEMFVWHETMYDLNFKNMTMYPNHLVWEYPLASPSILGENNPQKGHYFWTRTLLTSSLPLLLGWEQTPSFDENTPNS